MSEFIQVSRRKPRRDSRHKAATPPMPRNSEELIEHYERMVRLYKTERCREGFGRPFPFCSQGKLCFFAHSEGELRRDPLHDKGFQRYSRGMCQHRADCPKGNNCTFAHNDCETMYHPKTYKTKGCKHGDRCERTTLCAFSHDGDILTPELRFELFLDRDAPPSHLKLPAQPGADKPQSTGRRSRQNSMVSDTSDHGSRIGSPQHTRLQHRHQHQQLQASDYAQYSNNIKYNNGTGPQQGFWNTDNNVAAHAAVDHKRVDEEDLRGQPGKRRERKHSSVSESSYSFGGDPGSSPATPRHSPSGSVYSQTGNSAHAFPSAASPSVSRAASPTSHTSAAKFNGSVSSPASPLRSPSASHGTLLDPLLLKSTSLVIGLLVPNSPSVQLRDEQAEAILDVLAATEEGQVSCDAQGNTALLHAVSRGLYHFVSKLANPQTLNLANHHKQTPLSIVLQGDDRRMLEELIKHGVEVNDGPGALISAINEQSLECAMLLVRSQVIDFNLVDHMGNTALNLAAALGMGPLCSELCNQAAHLITHCNAKGETPLLQAAAACDPAAIVSLLQFGSDPNFADANGNTALILALLSDSPNAGICAESLLQTPGLDVCVRNSVGATALSLANRRGLHDVAQRLVELGANGVDGGSRSGAGKLCIMCMAAPQAAVAHPCAHTSLCQSCAGQWFSSPNKCPQCFKMVDSFTVEHV